MKALKTDMITSSMGPIEDINDVFPTDDSLSHQMLGFILAQTDVSVVPALLLIHTKVFGLGCWAVGNVICIEVV